MNSDATAILNALLNLTAENEVVEFKEAKNGYDFTKLGKYCSALSNEANLKRQRSAWLVFGVKDNRQVVGSQFRPARKDLDSLKLEILDMDYARLLARTQDLTLSEVVALDKVQKRHPLTDDDERRLKARGLIEGRKPNFYIAKSVAQQTDQKASYSKNKAFDNQYYLDLICKAIKEHGSLSRKDIDELLWNKLPDWMDLKQKKSKVGNLISELRKAGTISNQGTFKEPKWVLLKPV